MKFRLSILIIFITGFARNVQAVAYDYATRNYKFDHITIVEGLPNNRVDCIIQDHEGYLWFGTKRGLCRYNGYDFRNYTSVLNDTFSLRYHQITCLLESSDSSIWIGTWAGGLHTYNRGKDNFRRIDLGIQNDFTNNVTKIFEDSKGGIWIATEGKLFLLKKGVTETLMEITQPDGVSSLSNVSAFFEDTGGRIFIATDRTRPLFTFDPEKNLTSIYELISSTGVLPQKINQVYSFDKDNLWLAADNGLFNFSRETGTVAQIISENSPGPETPLNFILPDNDGNVWLGGNGLFVYFREERSFSRFTHSAGNPQTISGNIFTCGFLDNRENLWFGTFNQGINIIYHNTKLFNSDDELSEKLDNASKNITAIYKNDAGYLFVGTWDKGLLILNPKKEFVQSDNKFSGLRHLKNKIIRSIIADKDGILWIGSANGLLTRFDFRNNKSDVFSITGEATNSESQITSVLIGSSNIIWAANPTGVFRFEPGAGAFFELLSDANTQSIAEDSRGNIWCANYNKGLCMIKPNHTLSYFKSEGRNANLPDDKFVCIFRDSKDNMWVGTEFNGLFLYHPDTDHFQQFTEQDGLPSNDICSIEEDSKGRLWIGTNNGLSRFNYSLNNFSNYFRSDGMEADEFHYNASFKSKSGELYFGCTSGIVFFHPDDIRADFKTFPVKLEEISINRGEVNEDIHGILIDEALRNRIPFTLKYNQNTINFKYTTLSYSRAKNSDFAYQLVGLDYEPNFVGKQRQVTYTNLKPGKYIFKVIASNNDNIWDNTGTAISFKIKNPPWLSWWAYVIYGVILLLVLYGLRLQIRHEEKMKAAIRLERMEKDQQKELTQMKLRFFTNISHEFKTPLTLIIGPLEQIISDLHGNSALKSKLRQINTNSKRLLELINQLIDFRKIEQDVLPLEKTRNNLIETAQKVMEAFSQMAIKNEILFTLDTENEAFIFNFDKDKVEKILYNIISNAFKYTSKGGSISVRIWQGKEDKVNISLTDTGIGILPEKAKGIFELFNRTNAPVNNLNMESSGIGLAFSKKLAELHGGFLSLESKVNQGTTILVELPYDTQTLPENSATGQSVVNELNTPMAEQILPESEIESPVDLSHAPHILVVEDDSELRSFIVSILSEFYRTDEAGDGQTGYEMALKNDYDLILSDVMMPNMSGTQLCQKLKSNIKTSHIHVILLSAKSDFISTTEGFETGADSYLTKPFHPGNLLQVIKNLLSTRQHIKDFYTSVEDSTQEPPGIHPRDKLLISNAIAFIEKNIDEEDLSVEKLGKELGLSRTHLFRKFKSLTGSAPNDFIRQVKLKKAAQLISEGKFTISEIAYMVGFRTPANFSTSFKALYGKSPKEFKV